MKCSKRSFAVISPLFRVLQPLSIGTLNARDSDLASCIFAAAQTAKQKCINTYRARYRDCRRLNQAPSFQCRDVYQNCTRYTCTGLGRADYLPLMRPEPDLASWLVAPVSDSTCEHLVVRDPFGRSTFCRPRNVRGEACSE